MQRMCFFFKIKLKFTNTIDPVVDCYPAVVRIAHFRLVPSPSFGLLFRTFHFSADLAVVAACWSSSPFCLPFASDGKCRFWPLHVRHSSVELYPCWDAFFWAAIRVVPSPFSCLVHVFFWTLKLHEPCCSQHRCRLSSSCSWALSCFLRWDSPKRVKALRTKNTFIIFVM